MCDTEPAERNQATLTARHATAIAGCWRYTAGGRRRTKSRTRQSMKCVLKMRGARPSFEMDLVFQRTRQPRITAGLARSIASNGGGVVRGRRFIFESL